MLKKEELLLLKEEKGRFLSVRGMLKFGGLDSKGNWNKDSSFFKRTVKLSVTSSEKQMLRWCGVQVAYGAKGVEEEHMWKLKEEESDLGRESLQTEIPFWYLCKEKGPGKPRSAGRASDRDRNPTKSWPTQQGAPEHRYLVRDTDTLFTSCIPCRWTGSHFLKGDISREPPWLPHKMSWSKWGLLTI